MCTSPQAKSGSKASTKEEYNSKPTMWKWKQKMTSSTTDPFQASTSGTTSSVESHNIYSVNTMILCTIFTSHDHALEVCLVLKAFGHLCDKNNFHLPEIDYPSGKPDLMLTQDSITEIVPPPHANDTIHHI